MRHRTLISVLSIFCILFVIIYITSCESRTGITEPTKPDPNPYGEGNGKITFYRTQQITGQVIINISTKQLNDSLVWQSAPNCDSGNAVSTILKAGNYSVRIQGNEFLCDYNVNIEEKKCKTLNYTNCKDGNPYGNGNGKITFYKTQQIAGPIIIKIANQQITDSLVWQNAPNCDTNIAASKILPAGNYSVSIEGAVFLCNYNVNVEEKICKFLDYTNCNNGSVNCYSNLNGIWLRTSDGPCPNCQGMKVQFIDTAGEVIYTPPGCRFPLGDIKWKDFNSGNCTIFDLARDQYGGSPDFQLSNITFFNKDSLIINGPSGIIPYLRISYSIEKKNIKHITTNPDNNTVHNPAELQMEQ